MPRGIVRKEGKFFESRLIQKLFGGKLSQQRSFPLSVPPVTELSKLATNSCQKLSQDSLKSKTRAFYMPRGTLRVG